MDVALLQELVALNLEVSARLNIKRVRPGEYEVEGERVNLYWQTAELCVRARRPGRKRGRRSRRRQASPNEEEEEDTQDSAEMLLSAYLRQLANVESRGLPAADQQVDSIVAATAFAGATGGPSRLGGGVAGLGTCTPVLSNASYPQQPGVPPPQVGPYGSSFTTNPAVSSRGPLR
mmetsp:Transcript_64153/g.180568  ORF Transcript_64153/g.180568 Transcript_64153/m.180568 type:complete len:176 (-) Transcript_64153:94-621(-)